jgi:1-acyl-sn-glycerol-3-phosphate acyltransferase
LVDDAKIIGGPSHLNFFSCLERSILTAMTQHSGSAITSAVSPWLPPILYPLGSHVLHWYFSEVHICGQGLIPRTGPVILAPTHRSRWDAIVVPYIAGLPATGRHLRFMVSQDEMLGFQGWVIRHFGGFAINTRQPSVAALRHGVELLANGEALVIFPEGNIFRESQLQPLKPGLARLAIQATLAREQAGHPPDLQILPVSLHYSQPIPRRGDTVQVNIGQPLKLADYDYWRGKQAAKQLTTDLQTALINLQGSAPVTGEPALLGVF